MSKNKLKKKKLKKTWLVHFWAKVFKLFSYISLFSVIRKIAPKKSKSYSFVEYYVTINTLLSIVTLFIVTYRRNYEENWLLLFVMCFGFLRTFEIIIYQINVLLFDEYRAKLKGLKYAVRGYRRMVLLLLHNYVEIISWFGVAYMWFYRSGHISLPPNSPELTFLQVFHESMVLMFSFSPDQYEASTNMGFAVFTAQAIIGLFMTLVVFARFLGLLPPPDTMDEFESDID
ncbi:hypothetical protein [Psychroserpens sp.]|uniref:hypothetical protein n=1 Tax=Psychroserpens sp. TaxID=2020870 RepID=UPI002B269F1E|nr:hypothetical protein [Psychroserpens sp.]